MTPSLSPVRIVYLRGREVPFSEEELAAIFARYHEGDPLIQALRQILLTRLGDAIAEAALPRLSEREAGHAAGRLELANDLMHDLTQRLTKPPPPKR